MVRPAKIRPVAVFQMIVGIPVLAAFLLDSQHSRSQTRTTQRLLFLCCIQNIWVTVIVGQLAQLAQLAPFPKKRTC